MGGKVWSEEEERVFWTEIVPSSTKRHLLVKPYRDDPKGWDALCRVMQRAMGRRARRKYTALMLYEHYFQNSVLERFSPNAEKHVRDYIQRELSTTGQAPSERSRAVLRFARRGRGRPKSLAPVAKTEATDETSQLPLSLPLPLPVFGSPYTGSRLSVSALCEPDYYYSSVPAAPEAAMATVQAATTGDVGVKTEWSQWPEWPGSAVSDAAS